MNKITDETLMAYSDNELSPLDAERVRVALAADADLRDRLQHMRDIDSLLRASIQPELETPARFTQMLTAQDDANVVQLRPKSRSWREWVPAGTGIAAAVLILVGGSAVMPAQVSWLEQVDDGIALAGPLQAAMISTPSGQHMQRDGLNIMPVVSFTSSDGRMCREVHVDDDEMAARIVACRDRSENEWCIEAFARMPAVHHTNGYYTAGVTKDPVIDAAYARLDIKSTLSADAEKLAIKRGWVQN